MLLHMKEASMFHALLSSTINMCDSKARFKVNLKAVHLSSFIFSPYWSKKAVLSKKGKIKCLINNVNQYFWFSVTNVGSMKNNKCNTNSTQDEIPTKLQQLVRIHIFVSKAKNFILSLFISYIYQQQGCMDNILLNSI